MLLPLGHMGATVLVDPLIILALALIIDALLGEMGPLFRFVPHPVKLIGGVVAAGETRLNREWRSQRDRAVRGVLFTAVVILAATFIGTAVALFSQTFPRGWLLELFLTASLLAQRSLFDHVAAVAAALAKGGLPAGRQAVAHIVGREPGSLDEHGVARAAIESCAENFADAVVAPVFWYVLFGFPGLLVYKTANTLDSMIGHRNERYRAFGWAAARLDDILNLIPARLSGVVIALAAMFVPRAHPWRACRVMLRDARHHRSPNSGWPEAAMAGALDLSLAGPRHYPGYVAKEKWIGDGRARATADDIRRGLWVYAVACLLNFGGVIALSVASLR